MENKGYKVYGYVRVSSELQVKKDNSINSQIDFINDYCNRYKWDLIKIYEDLGVSGKVKSRNGLMELFNDLKKNNIDCLVVYSLSRFSRKLKDVLEFIEILEKNNIKFVSIKENLNSSEIVGKMMMGILGSVNEFEVNLLGERISDVKQNMVENLN